MGCKFPQTICGIKSQKVAIIFGFIELILHTLLLVKSIQFMADTIEEDDLKNQTQALKEMNGIGRENLTLVSNATSSDDDFEKFEETVKDIFQTAKDITFVLSLFAVIYEVFCLPTILILLCSLCKPCKCCTLPWFIKALFDIFIVVSLLLAVGIDIPIITFFLLLELVYVCFAIFAVLSGIYASNEVDFRNAEYSVPPGDTELKLIGGGHRQARV